jgi:FtsZ-interacting cell division protein ZipA
MWAKYGKYIIIVVALAIIVTIVYGVWFKKSTVIVQGITPEVYNILKQKDDSLAMKDVTVNRLTQEKEYYKSMVDTLLASKEKVKIIYKKEIEQYENSSESVQDSLLNAKYKKYFGGTK